MASASPASVSPGHHDRDDGNRKTGNVREKKKSCESSSRRSLALTREGASEKHHCCHQSKSRLICGDALAGAINGGPEGRPTPLRERRTDAGSVTAATILAHAQTSGRTSPSRGAYLDAPPWAGCWVALTDAEGNTLKLQVHDGAVDFRQVAAVGRYMVGEGIFTPTGNHGAQVHIGDHGARVGHLLCR